MLDEMIKRSNLRVRFVLIKGVTAEMHQKVSDIVLHHSIVDLAPFRVANETMCCGKDPPFRDKGRSTEWIEFW